MLQLQQYLRQGNPLISLCAEPYNLIVKEEGDLAILKYNQLTSDFTEEMVREARGIIFYKPTWDVVCYPFEKFFNYGEPYADEIDESELHIYQKIDGSLAKVWFFEGAWHLSSNGVIDASEVVMNEGVNFLSLFLRALSSYGLDWESFVAPLDKNYTYMYELATPDNKVVVSYDKYMVFYLGQRNNRTYQEEYHPDARIDNVKVYNFKSIEEITSAANELPDSEEGYVVRDKNWNRVKIKNPVYFMLHKIANNGKPDLLQYVLEHNEDELLAYFPEYKEGIEEIHRKLNRLRQRAHFHRDNMAYFRSIPRGEFANAVFRRGIPVYYQSYVFKTYENPDYKWEEYTQEWDIYKWRTILERAEGDLNV